MPQQQPKSKGIVRKGSRTYIHKLVRKELKAIAKSEDKILSYVLAEIVYKFFRLKVTKDDVIKLERDIHQKRKANLRLVKGRKAS